MPTSYSVLVDEVYKFNRALPYAECNPIDPSGRLLVGAFPRNDQEVNSLLAYGVDLLIVTDYDCAHNIGFYPQLRGIGIKRICCHAGKSMCNKNLRNEMRSVVWHHENGHTVMISSMMGCGRAEMLGAICVSTINDISASDAIGLVGWWRKVTRPSKEYHFVPTPENNAQVKRVHQSVDYYSPDRSCRSWAVRFNKLRDNVRRKHIDFYNEKTR